MSDLHNAESFSPLDSDYEKASAAMRGSDLQQHLTHPGISMHPPLDPVNDQQQGGAPRRVPAVAPVNPEKYLMPDDSLRQANKEADKDEVILDIDPREMPFMVQIAMNERDRSAAELTAKKARIALQEQYIGQLTARIKFLEEENTALKTAIDPEPYLAEKVADLPYEERGSNVVNDPGVGTATPQPGA